MYTSPVPVWAKEGCLYAAVERGEIYRYTDSEWEALPYEKDLGTVRSICGFSCDEVYMATSHHLFYHTETGWEEIPPPEDERFKINSLFCKNPGRLYIAGSGLYVWEDGEWTIELPAEQNADDAWMSRRFVWGHEDDDTLYVDHNSGHSTMVRKDGEDVWQEWSPDEIPADLYYDSFFVGGVRGFTEHTIWGFANHSYFAVRPENFGWNVDNLLYGPPTGHPDRAKSAWVTREGKVFTLGAGADISFVPFYGMTVKNPD